MFKKILIGLVGLLVVLAVVVSMQPSTYHVERSIEIAAPAGTVWAEVSNFAQWKGWNAWHKSDPSQKETLAGEPSTVGHSSTWDGEKTGKGKMTIVEASAPNKLKIGMEFYEPFAGEGEAAFNIKPKKEGVVVTWTMDGKNDFIGKFFGLLMDMDEMIGSMYDKGLADLKQLAEKTAKEEVAAALAEAAALDAEAGEDSAGDAEGAEDGEPNEAADD